MQKFSQIKLYNEYIVNTNVVLGKGSTGSVYEGQDLRNGSKVAVKVIDLATIDNEVMEYLLSMEKTALMTLNSPSILKGLRVMQDQKFCFIVTEYCNGGTLKNYIQSKGLLS
jgi:serine/threonine protein kinase